MLEGDSTQPRQIKRGTAAWKQRERITMNRRIAGCTARVSNQDGADDVEHRALGNMYSAGCATLLLLRD